MLHAEQHDNNTEWVVSEWVKTSYSFEIEPKHLGISNMLLSASCIFNLKENLLWFKVLCDTASIQKKGKYQHNSTLRITILKISITVEYKTVLWILTLLHPLT